MDFSLSDRAQDYLTRIRAFMAEHIEPIEAEYHATQRAMDDPFGQIQPVMHTLKAKAKAQGLWNLFLPDEHHGAGLTNVEYASLAEAMGHSFIAPEVFNCSAPDTGNMEVLHMYGTPAQQERWLKPLLAGEIRSAFGMTEPGVASSDATNIESTAVVDGDEIVLNGRKWWTSGIGHPDCELIIFMAKTDPDAPRHAQHSMVLVERSAPGVKVERMMEVFGDTDPPVGHGEVSFTDVRVPKDNFILGPGRGFEIAQGRLGPGRIHHCMRAIGAAERTLKLLCERAASRVAFGKPIALLGGNLERISEARMAIDQARLLTLHAAWKIDQVGTKHAKSEIGQIKVAAPRALQMVVDMAIQFHGGAGVSQDTPLAALFGYARTLRIVDGPDDVHRMQVGKIEMSKYLKRA